MPTMIRPKGKGMKIAYDILGQPDNMKNNRRRRKKKETTLINEPPLLT